jgi:hypothetical protein
MGRKDLMSVESAVLDFFFIKFLGIAFFVLRRSRWIMARLKMTVTSDILNLVKKVLRIHFAVADHMANAKQIAKEIAGKLNVTQKVQNAVSISLCRQMVPKVLISKLETQQEHAEKAIEETTSDLDNARNSLSKVCVDSVVTL